MSAVDLIRAWVESTRALLAQVEGALPPSSEMSEPFGAWGSRWFARRRAAGIERERRAFVRWIVPQLGCIDATRLSRSDVEGWVEHMDGVVRAGRLRWGTARRVWILLRRMLAEMSRSKLRELRVRTDNPAQGVRGPDHGPSRESTFLYPSELLRLMSCEAVPLTRRRIYAITTYLALRFGELGALEWADVDFSTRAVHVHRSRDRLTGRSGPTKTAAGRRYVLPRTIVPLMRAMARQAKGADLVAPMWARTIARELRQDLRLAGCRRGDLFADDETRRPFTFHDLRATGITWMAMRGDSVTEIMERAGHAQLATTQLYLRRGRVLAVARGERPFPTLPACLLGKST